MALPTPGVTPANWGAQLNAEIAAAQDAGVNNLTKSGGNYIATAFPITNTATFLNHCTASPFPVHARGASFQQVAVNVFTAGAAGAVMRLGVYADNGGFPGALIADWGTVDATTTGDKTISISWSPAGGLYWLAAASQGASCTMKANNGSSAAAPLSLSGASLTNALSGNAITGFGYDIPAGPLPANWTTTVNSLTFTNRIALRVA